MRNVLYMAWRYLAYHRLKTAVLVVSIALIVTIPAGLEVLARQSENQLRARAQQTPLLIAIKGSPVEMVLNALYFSADATEAMHYAEARAVAASGLAEAIPLYVRFHSQDDPIVGTTLDYFAFRNLDLAAGNQMARLGDCVVGSAVAKRRGVGPGDSLLSSPESVFDLTGVYPLKLRITGVLASANSPDDEAIFVDVKTAWVIQGLAHGHQDLSKPEASAGVLRREDNRIVGNAAVVQYNEITDDNVDSFHFHGDPDTFPITAVLAVPPDDKSGTILTGRYLTNEQHQILKPIHVVDDLLATVFTVKGFVIAALAVVALATVALAALVFLLSAQLRRREIETMVKIGAARRTVAAILLTEVVMVLVLGVALAGGLIGLTSRFAADAIRIFLL